MPTVLDFGRAATRVVAAALIAAPLSSCGSQAAEDPRIPSRLQWGTGNCSIIDDRCLELVDVGIFPEDCAVTMGRPGTGNDRFDGFYIEKERCHEILAPVLTREMIAAVRRGGSCDGTPPKYFRIKYQDQSIDRISVGGCSGEPYDTIARVRQRMWDEAAAHIKP